MKIQHPGCEECQENGKNSCDNVRKAYSPKQVNGAHLGYLTGARHSHLDSAGYSLDQKALTTDRNLSPSDVAAALWQEEAWRQVLSSLVICFFARGVYTPEIIQKALHTIGLEYTPEELSKLGEEILKLKHHFKKREGFDLGKIRIPDRILEIPSSRGIIDGDFIRQTLIEFNTISG